MDNAHPPTCTCAGCLPAVALAEAGGLDIRWRKMPVDVVSDYLEAVYTQKITTTDLHEGLFREYFSRFKHHAEAGWGKRFKDASGADEWEMMQRIERNLRDFTAHKQATITGDLRKLLQGTDGKRDRKEWEKEAMRVMKRHNGLYLRAELDTATQAAQAAESWQEFERRKYLYPNLRYETAGDERVRESHRSLDGTVRPVDDPFWDTYYPPNGWRCFTPETEVLTPNGWKMISDVKSGDLVIGGSGNPQTVEAIHTNYIDSNIIGLVGKKRKIRCTENHRILTTKGWIRAENLEVGDIVIQLPEIPSLKESRCQVNHVQPVLNNISVACPEWAFAIDAFNSNPQTGQININPISTDIVTEDGLLAYFLEMANNLLFVEGGKSPGIGMRLGVFSIAQFFGCTHFGPNIRPYSRGINLQNIGDSCHERTISFGQAPLSNMSASLGLSPILESERNGASFPTNRIPDPLSFNRFTAPSRFKVEMPEQINDLLRLHFPALAEILKREQFIKIETSEGFTGGAPLDSFNTIQDFIRYAFFHLQFVRIDEKQIVGYKGNVLNLSVSNDESYVTRLAIVHNCRCKVIQTDQATTGSGAADFEPPKGFRQNVGKTGKLFGDDHPYFNQASLDAERIRDNAARMHAKVSRQEVREWAKDADFSFNLPHLSQPVTLSKGEAKTITGKPHQESASRNNLLYVLATMADKLRYIDKAAEAGRHPNVAEWYYYTIQLDGIDYYLNLWKIIGDDERIGIHAITDYPPDFGGP